MREREADVALFIIAISQRLRDCDDGNACLRRFFQRRGQLSGIGGGDDEILRRPLLEKLFN